MWGCELRKFSRLISEVARAVQSSGGQPHTGTMAFESMGRDMPSSMSGLSHSGGFGLREVRCLRAPVVAVAGACTAPNPTRAGAMTAVRPGSLCPDTCRRAELQAPCPAIPPARS